VSAMHPDPLQRLQQRADRMGRLAHELTAATPHRTEGCDATGRVVVVLDRDGLPEQIRVRDGWQQRLDSDRLGAAVVDAFRDAVQQAMHTWTDRLDDTRWWSRQQDLDETPDHDPTTSASSPVNGRARDDLEFSEPILRALHATRHSTGDQPIVAEGVDGGRHVWVRLGSGGLVGCEIDPRWARDRDGSTISAALHRALSQARSAVAVPAETAPPSALDAALADAIATLAALTNPSPRRDDRQ
jgi:DNA-binding protein YbaB